MMSVEIIYIWIIISSSFGINVAFLNSEQSCKVYVDDKHTELKNFINKQNEFSLNNWSHISGILIIGLLSLLLLAAYCYIKAKIRNLTKKSQKNHYPGKDGPYIIFKKGMENLVDKEQVQEV